MSREKLIRMKRGLSFLYGNRQVLLLAFCLVVLYFLKDHNVNHEIRQEPGSSAPPIYVEISKPDRFSMVLRFRNESELKLLRDRYRLSQQPKSGDKLIVHDDGSVEATRMSGSNSLALSIPIGINTAGKEDLVLLPGIGVKLAGKIVEWRTANGRFDSVEELEQINGIGRNKIEALKPFLSLD